MEFDRFDICEAYYLFLSFYHEGQWSDKYKRLCKLLKYFKPSDLLRDEENLSENGRAIFWELERQEFNRRNHV